MIRRSLLWILIVAVLHPSLVRATADTDPEVSSVRLIAGRSTVLEIGAPISRISLTTADVADALVTSPSQLIIHGKTPGAVSLFVWERSGPVRRYEVIVARDVARLSDQVKQLFPRETIAVSSNGRDIVLSGSVTTKEVADQVINLSTGFADRKEDVVSLLRVQLRPTNQVLLKVRFAEVSRSALTELGSSLFTGPQGKEGWFGRSTTQQFAAPTFEDDKLVFSDFLNLFLFSAKDDLGVVIRALQTKGLFQSLAEPNLVAESGKEASFLAGGEFPIPVTQPGGGNAISVQFKEFGVRLNFTPVVEGDRVRLKVRPEVSTLDFANGVHLDGFRIPALISRRTETELELRDGQTFAIAGLLNNTLSSTMQKIPGIGDIPILGLLFRSKAANKDRTELVVMITPHILPEGSFGVTREVPRLGEPYLAPIADDKALPNPAPPFPQPSASIAPAAQQVAAPAPAPAVMASVAAPAPAAAPKPTAEERKAAKTRAEAEARAAKTEAERQRVEAERQKKAAREQAKRDAEEARRKAEAERRTAEEAKRQADAEKKRQAALAEAEKKLRAAEAAYQAEKASTSRQ